MSSAPPVALITGASSGFGAFTAATFAARGVRVFGTSRHATAALLALDVDDDASTARCIDEVMSRAGRIDYLVNNAGRALAGACEETSASDARALFETNLFGVMRVVNRVLPVMRAQGHGSIVNVGSVSGFIGVPFHGVYAATKHALAGYTEALRVEVEPFGVRVALVEPSAHRTSIAMAKPSSLMSIYDRRRDRVEAIIRAQIDTGGDPQRVATAICAAALRDRPPFRIRVGAKAILGAWARRLLPIAVFEAFLRHEFRLRRRRACDRKETRSPYL